MVNSSSVIIKINFPTRKAEITHTLKTMYFNRYCTDFAFNFSIVLFKIG